MNKKERLVRLLKKSVRHWNLYRKLSEYTRVDMKSADLSKADLFCADLRYTNLNYANLRAANLSYAKLFNAKLFNADLSYTNLRFADLRYVDFRYAVLRFADLQNANLCSADLREASVDFSSWPLSCKSLAVQIDSKIVRQLLFHACKPVEKSLLDMDQDIQELFELELFKKVVNNFHKIEETGKFIGELK